MTEVQLDPETLRAIIARELLGARQRTTLLTDSVDEADLVRQHSPLMSPLVWDLAHIANQEELWLLREVGGREPMHPEIDPLYDAFEHPRSERPTLPLLPPAEARAYGHEVRGRVLDLLDRAPFSGTRLLGDGFAFGMIAQHEVQHDETMLITHQIRAGAPVLAARAPDPAPADAFRLPPEVLVPGGPFTMGTSTEPWALDNERPAHTVQVAPFYLDTTPVTCGAYAQFIDGGGYDDPRWWTAAGWEHRQDAGLTAPLYWRREGPQWTRRVFGRQEPIVPNEPVLHVSWYEADAYARWAGRRLPTEAEWEKAARFDPATGLTRRYPWGNADPDTSHANLSQAFLRPAPAGSYPGGAAPCGARQLIGDVWEWTSSDFSPYPGFEAWPYKEYSEVFFGPEYKVLRGGSFAVSPVVSRGTFRNWDYPIRRQIFAGFRTARSAVAETA
jgi:iron(II)-dependent oxidoreductase